MQTIEIIVYLSIALIIGSLILVFLKDGGFSEFYDDLVKMHTKEPGFKKVDTNAFVGEAASFWQDCGFGEINKSLALYIEGEGVFNRSMFFSTVSKINYCDTLQSASEGCGNGENVIFEGNITLPRVVRLECDSQAKKLVIT